MKVFVVTNTNNGWDCVDGVYYTREAAVRDCAAADGLSPEDWNENNSDLIIHEKTIED